VVAHSGRRFAAALGPVDAPSPLLSPERSASEARRLRGWSAADRDLLAEALRERVTAWADGWGLSDWVTGDAAFDDPASAGPGNSSALARAEAEGSSWSTLPAESGGDGLWWRLRPAAPASGVAMLTPQMLTPGGNNDSAAALHAGLFGEPDRTTRSRDRLSDELATLAWTDWCRRVAACFAPPPAKGQQPAGAASAAHRPEDGAAALLRPWSGALVFTLAWGGTALALLVSAQRIAAALDRIRPAARMSAGTAPRAPLIPLLDVLGAAPVTLRAELADLEIGLGQLSSLRPGDVLCTTHPLTSPLRLTLPAPADARDRPLLCHAVLGKCGEQRAVELAAPGR
jgi:flagellar motor switch/type III secretory pathway protein FliN